MIAGTLELQLYADVARLTKDMADAKGIVSRGAQSMEKAAAAARSALMSIGAGLSVGAVAAFVKTSIDAADAMAKLSAKTGISTETLSGYQRAAELSDVSTEKLGDAFRALARNMSNGNDAFVRYGIATTDTNGKLLATDRVFEQVADRLQQIPNGAERAALAMDLLGKTGSDLIPMLKDGSTGLEMMRIEAELAGTVIGGQLAEDSERFNDNLTKLGQAARGAGNSIAEYFLPALNGMIEFLNARPAERLAEINEELAKLAAENDYTGFADIRIAKLEEERIALDKIVKLERQRKALAGAAALGDIRDARDRGGEADGLAPAIAKQAAKGIKAIKPQKEDFSGRDAAIMAQHELAMGAIDADKLIAAEHEAMRQEMLKLDAEADEMERLLIEEKSMAQYDFNRMAFEAEFLAKTDEFVLQSQQLQEWRDAEYISEQQYEEQRAVMVEGYLLRLGTAEAKAAKQRSDFAKMSAKQQTEFVLGQLVSMTSGAARESRTMFEINKAASMANIVMNTYDSAMASFKWGAAFGGPVFGGAMAAIAIAAGLANLGAVRGLSFGDQAAPSPGTVSGGSAVPSAQPAASSSSAADVQAQQGVAAQATRVVNVTLIGDAFDYKMIAEKLIPAINEAVGNGVNLRVSAG